jgi:hypothetical protein
MQEVGAKFMVDEVVELLNADPSKNSTYSLAGKIRRLESALFVNSPHAASNAGANFRIMI